MIIAVGSGVFVPETDDVTEFVHHDAELVAVLADGDGLGSVAPLADEGTAPARSLREYDVVLLVLPLDERGAGVVLPMTHRHLEERLVRPGEIRVDHVRNHRVVPQTLWTRRRRATDAAF